MHSAQEPLKFVIIKNDFVTQFFLRIQDDKDNYHEGTQLAQLVVHGTLNTLRMYFLIKQSIWMWWHMPLIMALTILREQVEFCEFQVSQDYTVRPSHQNKVKQSRNFVLSYF